LCFVGVCVYAACLKKKDVFDFAPLASLTPSTPQTQADLVEANKLKPSDAKIREELEELGGTPVPPPPPPAPVASPLDALFGGGGSGAAGASGAGGGLFGDGLLSGLGAAGAGGGGADLLGGLLGSALGSGGAGTGGGGGNPLGAFGRVGGWVDVGLAVEGRVETNELISCCCCCCCCS
jgi:hypothetical protein